MSTDIAILSHRDALGAVITPGDVVVYASMCGQSPQLRLGAVVALGERETRFALDASEKTLKLVVLTSLDRDADVLQKLITIGKLDHSVMLASSATLPSALREKLEAALDARGVKLR